MSKGSCFRYWLTMLVLLVAYAYGDATPNSVAQGKALMLLGKPLDALKVYEGLLFDQKLGGKEGGEAFLGAVRCLKRLGREKEYDALCKKALSMRPKDWAFAAEASNVLGSVFGYGRVRSNQFHRGDHRNSGEWVDVRETDRRFWIRELSLRNPGKIGSEFAPYYVALGRALMRDRVGPWEFWRLQLLTDLSKPVDYTCPDEELESSESLPLTRDGRVLFYEMPKNWEAANNDGERYLWTLKQAEACEKNGILASAHARMCQVIYGVKLHAAPAESPQYRLWEQLPELSDDESVVQAGGTWRRIRVPDCWNAIAAYKALGDHSRLGQIYEGRRQYGKALEHWRAVVDKRRIAQITENWCQFQPAEVQLAGRQPEISLLFRNASTASFKAYNFDYEKFMEDSIGEFLKGSDRRGSWRYGSLGSPQVYGEKEIKRLKTYVKDEVASWKLQLEPKAGYLDTLKTMKAPLTKAGGYWVTCEVPGGKKAHVLVFLRDRMIVSSPRVQGHAWQVLDAESGAPVAGVQVEFLAYTRVWERRNGRSVSRLEYRRMAEVADRNGMVFIPEGRLKIKVNQESHYLGSIVAMIKSHDGRLLLCGSDRAGNMQPMEEPRSRYQMFYMSDRPVYRPGQKVHYSFWTGRGDYGEAAVRNPWGGKKGKLTITTGRGKTLVEEERTLDEFGGLSGELPLDSSAELGHYRLTFRVPGKLWGYGSFRVEEYRKPEYEVKVDVPKEAPLLGETFKVAVTADYYFGAPVTEGTVSLKIMRRSHRSGWYPLGNWDWLYGSGYGWLCRPAPWYRGWQEWGGFVGMEHWFPYRGDRPEVVVNAEGPIGKDGRYEVTLDTAAVKELLGDRDHEYSITAVVRDASRRSVVGKGEVIVARKPFQSIVWLNRGYAKVGESITALMQARTLGGDPVSGKGKLTLYRVSYDEKNEPVETPERSWDVPADGQGLGKQLFSASRAGQYRLGWTVTDSKGRSVEGGVLFSVVGEGYDGRDFRFNALELIPDKATYAPGEVVRLLINTEKSGSTVMLHVQGLNEGKEDEVQVIRLAGKSSLVEIPVRQGNKPNFHVTAYSIQDGEFHTVSCSLPVPPEKRILQVDIEANKKAYEPGDKGRISLTVKDMKGKPISGRVVVTVYDKSIDALAGGGQSVDIRKFFWDWRRPENFFVNPLLLEWSFRNMIEPGQLAMSPQQGGYGMRYSASARYRGAMMMKSAGAVDMSQNVMMAAAPMAKMETAAMDVAPAEGSASSGDAPVPVRTVFADTALWAVNVTTDAQGKATLPLDLPENLTTWRIRVWAMADGTKVGEGESEVIVSKTLLIRPQVPRFFQERDAMVISGVVHNYGDREEWVTISLTESSKCLDLPKDSRRRVKVPGKGGQVRINWNVKVQKPGNVVLRMTAAGESGKLSDGVECKVPAQVHGMDIVATQAGKMSEKTLNQEITVKIPENIRAGSGKIDVRLTPSLAGVMLDALPYLISAPDGTTDQVLSRFLPLVQVRQTLKRLGLSLVEVSQRKRPAGKTAAEQLDSLKPLYDDQALERLVRKGLDDLVSMQCSDGGWGWFAGWGEVSTSHMTSQVVYGLLLAKECGLGVPEQSLTRGLSWLKNAQSERVMYLKKEAEAKATALDALTYRVLCKGGMRHAAMEDFLFRDRASLPLRGVALYALGLQNVKEETKLDEMMTILMQYVRRDSENGTAWLEQGEGAWWFWYYDDIETLADCVQLLIARDPKSQLAAEMALYLVNNRRHGTYWRSTRDTSACLDALSAFMVASGEARSDLNVQISLDGKELERLTMKQGALKSGGYSLTLSGEQVVAGNQVLKLVKSGTGPLYWTVQASYFGKEEQILPQGLELKVERRVYLLTPDDRMSAGADCNARVLAMKREGWKRRELKDGDRVNSGDLLEVELTVISKNDYEYLLLEDRKAAGWEPVDQRSGYQWHGLSAYREFRDAAVKFYLRSLCRGTHAVSYRVRAEFPGRFNVMPTMVKGVYAPELRGNAREQQVVIEER